MKGDTHLEAHFRLQIADLRAELDEARARLAEVEEALELAQGLVDRLEARGLGADKTQVHVLATDIKKARAALAGTVGQGEGE